MTGLPAPLRKAGLTAHVLCSVGWIGAVLVFLVLGIAAVHSDDPALIRGAYLVMEWAGWTVLVPLAVGSVLTGVLQSLATPWGLFRHYWVIIKLILAVVATVVLVAYTDTLTVFAEVAARDPFMAHDLQYLRSPSVVLHSSGALALLITATVLAIYKPQGLTRRGQRQRRRAAERRSTVSGVS